jgi:hypothetical protein
VKRVAHSLVGAVIALLVLGPALALAQFGGGGGLHGVSTASLNISGVITSTTATGIVTVDSTDPSNTCGANSCAQSHATGSAVTGNSASVSWTTGNTTTGNTGDLNYTTGATDTGTTGSVNITTGNVTTLGSGGNVLLTLGAAAGDGGSGGGFGITTGSAPGTNSFGGGVAFAIGNATNTGSAPGYFSVTGGSGADDDANIDLSVKAKGSILLHTDDSWTGGSTNVYAPLYAYGTVAADNKPLALFVSTPGSGITNAPSVSAETLATNALASGELRVAVKATIDAHASDHSSSDTAGFDCAQNSSGPGRESCLHNDASGLQYLIDSDGGHVKFAGGAPTLSSCGSTPAAGTSSDTRGRVTTGSGTVNGCTISFSTAFATAPFCVVGVDDSTTALPTWTTSTSALTVTFAVSSPSKHVSYICIE